MDLKVLLLIGCISYGAWAKPVTNDEPNDVQEGVASLVVAIDDILGKSDDIKTSEIRDLATELLKKTSEFDDFLDILILEVSKGVYNGRRNPDVPIPRPKGPAAKRLSMEDQFVIALLQSLQGFKEAMIKVAEEYDPDDATRDVLKKLKVLKQITWGIRQVGLTLTRISKDAESDLEELMLDIQQDESGPGEEKALKRRNWSFKLDGAHWNRGNHHFQIGPTFGRGGFGGGATYTFRFK